MKFLAVEWSRLDLGLKPYDGLVLVLGLEEGALAPIDLKGKFQGNIE